MSLSESLGAGDTEAPAELVVPDYGAPAVSADKGPTSMGSEPAPAPAAAASGTAGGLAGLSGVHGLPDILSFLRSSTRKKRC